MARSSGRTRARSTARRTRSSLPEYRCANSVLTSPVLLRRLQSLTWPVLEQFYVFEIARNRLGLNDKAHEIAKEEAAKEKEKAEKEKARAERRKAKKN